MILLADDDSRVTPPLGKPFGVDSNEVRVRGDEDSILTGGRFEDGLIGQSVGGPRGDRMHHIMSVIRQRLNRRGLHALVEQDSKAAPGGHSADPGLGRDSGQIGLPVTSHALVGQLNSA